MASYEEFIRDMRLRIQLPRQLPFPFIGSVVPANAQVLSDLPSTLIFSSSSSEVASRLSDSSMEVPRRIEADPTGFG